MSQVIAYLGLGSNLGGREATLRQAVADLSEQSELSVVRVSSFYETAPVGPIADQPPFLNAVAAVETTLLPTDLLQVCLAVEQHHGRNRVAEVRWGPRTLDIDVLLYGETVLDLPGLTLPHPRLHERAFVLIPLLEIAPDLVHPGLGISIENLLNSLGVVPAKAGI